ncbi:MAG: ABC transporter ATP-binding protein [Bacteroidales bacterium]|nr:ABC transporter ATP-binding protein [Bacteroidales bacterium]
MIKIQNIHKAYGELEILKDINLELDKGEVISIVGKSGAGKTTLLQIIGTLLGADQGRILINDTEVTNLKDKKLSKFRNEHIGFIFQFHNLLPEFTAIENVCIPAYIAGKSPSEAQKRAKELLEFLNLCGRITHKPSELSGGEQQRVAVARALINSPDVILADEPSGNLDTAHKVELHNLFFKLRDDFNQTFVIVTHDEQLASMSDRTIRLRDGVVVEDTRKEKQKPLS